jgi:hypothetical protein
MYRLAQTLAQLVPRDELARALEKSGKGVERLIGKGESDVPVSQFACAQVELEVTETDHRAGGGFWHWGWRAPWKWAL